MSQGFKILIIGFVWPEPQSSAAGLRDWNLIDTFLGANWKLVYASPAKENLYSKRLQEKGIEIHSVQPNDPEFDKFIESLKPDFVIFDRFMIEEQFGWRVQEACPEAIRILDTIDLHFLRRGRQEALKQNTPLKDIFDYRQSSYSEDTLREIASIYRSDCSLILSSFEMALLTEQLKIPQELLFLSRFHYPPPPAASGFHERQDFVTLGNFRHPPNEDGVRWLHKEIWPLIRKELPQANLFIYGAYPPREMMKLTDKKTGFHVMGSAVDQFETLGKYRVNLAALRFGAGIKGKISDGWWTGTPVVTTPIGSEGMTDDLPWGGEIALNASEFAKKAVALYTQEHQWSQAQQNGFQIIQESYAQSIHSPLFLSKLIDVKNRIQEIRQGNLIGAMLGHHLHRSTKYFSKWIEEKNKTGSNHF